jgi:phosphoglycolate phosphatase
MARPFSFLGGITMAIKGILFDLDGTLCNTLQDLADATNGVLVRHGFDARPVENFKQYVGNGAKMQLKRAIGEEVSQDVFDTMLTEYLADYGVGYLKATAPYDGVMETVQALHQKGITMAVVTNKPQQMATNIVKELFGDMFCGVWGNNPDFPLKPDPSMTLYVMNQLQLSPEETLFVGDSGVDMLTAKNAGVTAVGVEWGFRHRDELQKAGADHILQHPLDLLKLI